MTTEDHRPTADERIGDIALAVRTFDAHMIEHACRLEKRLKESNRQLNRIAVQLAKLNETPKPTPEPGTIEAGLDYGRTYATPKEDIE